MSSHLSTRLRVVYGQSRTPFGIAHDDGAELGISGKPSVVGGAAEERDERQTLLSGDSEVMVSGKHVFIPPLVLGVELGSTHHLRPPFDDMRAVLVAYSTAEHRCDIWSLHLNEVIKPVEPSGEPAPSSSPLIDRWLSIAHI